MIHDEILQHVEAALKDALITSIPEDDPARAGVVKLGNLDGDPDIARISVNLYENDPDRVTGGGATGMRSDWSDVVEFVEIGGATTWRRRFTIKARCLLENSKETLEPARQIASMVRGRIEHALPTIDFSDIDADGEYISRRIVSRDLRSEMFQSGGPPDSYDFHIKVRFDLLTTAKESLT